MTGASRFTVLQFIIARSNKLRIQNYETYLSFIKCWSIATERWNNKYFCYCQRQWKRLTTFNYAMLHFNIVTVKNFSLIHYSYTKYYYTIILLCYYFKVANRLNNCSMFLYVEFLRAIWILRSLYISTLLFIVSYYNRLNLSLWICHE